MNNTYYPPVKICNNTTEFNSNLLNRQLTQPKGLVKQNIFREHPYKIGNSDNKHTNKHTNKQMILFNKKLYQPIKNNIQLESQIHNINTIYSKCQLNHNNKPVHYTYPVNNNVNLCLYPKYPFNPCIPHTTSPIFNQLNSWNIYQKPLPTIPSHNIHKFTNTNTNTNTIPFMLNQKSVSKPLNPNCNIDNKKCPSLFNHQTKQKNYYQTKICL